MNRAEALRLLENLYHEHGQDFSEKDVPHFLPAILEFLSTVSYNEALSWIKQAEPGAPCNRPQAVGCLESLAGSNRLASFFIEARRCLNFQH